MAKALVVGVDMVKFMKPGSEPPFRVMASEAIRGALADAGLNPEDIQQAYASYVIGDSASGQHALYDVVQAGIPVINVNNNCSSGSTALFLARQAVQSGAADCVLAFGFEQMRPGALRAGIEGLEQPIDRMAEALGAMAIPPGPPALRCFGAAGQHYLDKYDADPAIFSQVAVKNRRHAQANPYALFTDTLAQEQVSDAPVIWGNYLTRLMACPPTCGAAAALVVSEDFARAKGISGAVEILAQSMTTDTENSWRDPIMVAGYDMTRRAADAVYEQSGLGPEAIQVVELHDCFTPNEVITYEALSLCGEGEATQFIESDNNTYGGRIVVNPSGGLMSKGHPVGATGLAQCFELVKQLRGEAGERQVVGASRALQHNLGLGGAAVVTLYQKMKI